MSTAPASQARPYWSAVASHDLTLMLVPGRLWKFRAAPDGTDVFLDAQLEPDGLLVTCSSRETWDEVFAEVGGHLVRFTRSRGSQILSSEVLLPEGIALDEDHVTTSRRDGVLEVRVPLAAAPALQPEVPVGPLAA